MIENTVTGRPAKPTFVTSNHEAVQRARRLEALGNLASGMAHDFGNELQIIIGAIELISDSSEIDGLARGIHMLNEVVERAASVVRRLLAYAREDVLHTTQVAVPDLLAGLQEVLRHTLPRQVDVRVNTTNDPSLQVWADKSQLQTVLLNLANNARDAMGDAGHLTLTASFDQDVEVDAGGLLLAKANYVRLDVSDTGCGMSPSTLARASEPFFTTKGPGSGTGLGLAMARGFAEQSGGALSITSRPGCGTTVSMWLPVAAAELGFSTASALPAVAATPAARNASRQLHIVLVDDVKSVSDVVARQLAKEGIHVSVVDQAADVQRMMAGPGQIDLMITDFSMPGMGGEELIRQTHEIRPEMPIILLTGHPFDCESFLRTYRCRSLIKLLTKPVSRSEILRCILSSLANQQIHCLLTGARTIADM